MENIRKEIRKVKKETSHYFCKLCNEEFHEIPENHWISYHKYPTVKLPYDKISLLKSEEEHFEWCDLCESDDEWEGLGWYTYYGEKIDLDRKIEEYEGLVEYYQEILDELKKRA